MSKFVITGGTPLEGDFPIAGMKNAATPLIAAALLLKKPVTLYRVPSIIDVERMCELAVQLGAQIERSGDALTINPQGLRQSNPDSLLVKRLRSSVLLLGPLLALFGKVSIPTPGGCSIGTRPIDTHLDAFRQLGVKVTSSEDETYTLEKSEKPLPTVILSEFSVTATENAIMYASTLEQSVVIKMAAAEPHVQDVCNFLIKAGAKIEGVGSHELCITGSKNLSLDTWTVIPDQIEIGTMAVAAAVTGGRLNLSPVVPAHLDSILRKFDEIGVNYEVGKENLEIKKSKNFNAFRLQALPHPGFPTDLQAPMAILATQATGLSLIHDPLYNARFSYIQELSRMGAQAVVCDPHRVLLSGPTQLHGERIKSFDLRAGVTLLIAGLIAKGETVIDDAEMVDRGYEFFEKRLQSVGAKIKRED